MPSPIRWSGFGRLDILVNNAAITSTKSIWEVGMDEWDAVMAVNLRGTFIGSRAAARQMRRQGAGGRIVNIASIAGQTGGVAAGPHYAASKAGILLLTKAFARELASDRITVNAVAAAAIEGPNMQNLSQADRDRIVKSIPIGRFSRDGDVTSAVIYLASEEAGFVTGATIDVNGGLFLR